MTSSLPPLSIAVVVVGGAYAPNAATPTIRLSIMVSTSQGHEISTDVDVSVASSVQQTNQAIEQRARRALADTYGMEVANMTPVRLFGGATS